MHGLLLAGLLALPLQVLGHPAPKSTNSLGRRGVDLDAYRLPVKAKYVNSAKVEKDSSFRVAKSESYVEVATQLVKKVAPKLSFRVVDDHYVGRNGIGHVNFRQTIHGLDVDNADINVNVGKDGQVFSFGNSFYTGEIPKEDPRKKADYADPVDALKGATKSLKLPVGFTKPTAKPAEGLESYVFEGASGTLSKPSARLVYLVNSDGKLVLTWRVETDIGDNWLLSYVDAKSTDKVHNVVDYVAEADYEVYTWGLNDPTEGSRTVIPDPWDSTSSEFTWLGDGSSNYTTTRGNNGIAQNNPSGGNEYLNNYRPDSDSLSFKYPYTPDSGNPDSYVDASITQLFYTSNMYHDLLYILGFDEAAGNFEQNNNGQGGQGNDFVILNSQDGSGKNNANFATPPDGQPGRMRMYTWTTSQPERDGCFEAGIVIHEYTHGVSNRLTGGPSNAQCLGGLESGGMGEGWGDFMATAIRVKGDNTRDTDYPMGSWAANDPSGIRAYPYSTNLNTNPHVYTDCNNINQVHAIGTVWASMLYEVLWNLIDTHGNNEAERPEMDGDVPKDGRYLAMKLVLDGMALQPCNPNFVQARDAILDADKALTDGANLCDIWKGFAKRGLGEGAVYSQFGRTGSEKVPDGVC